MDPTRCPSIVSSWALAVVLAACGGARTPSSGGEPAPGVATTPTATEPASRPASSFDWAVPEGWRSETIPFPLGFAPELAYRGVEEIRFAPGFFDATAPAFWSYVFAWWLEGGPTLTVPQLQTDLQTYFVGLARAVADGKFETHPENVTVKLREVPSAAPGATSFTGDLRIFDAFKTRKELGLAVEGLIFACGDRRVLLLAASPKGTDDATMWKPLRDCMATFRCE